MPPSSHFVMVLSTEWSQVEVIDLINDGNGLGFILVGGKSTGVVIKAMIPGENNIYFQLSLFVSIVFIICFCSLLIWIMSNLCVTQNGFQSFRICINKYKVSHIFRYTNRYQNDFIDF